MQDDGMVRCVQVDPRDIVPEGETFAILLERIRYFPRNFGILRDF